MAWGCDIGLTELTKHAILSYPLLDQQSGEKVVAHKVASPEMLYISGSSGAQFDERVLALRGADDVVSAIESAISDQ